MTLHRFGRIVEGEAGVQPALGVDVQLDVDATEFVGRQGHFKPGRATLQPAQDLGGDLGGGLNRGTRQLGYPGFACAGLGLGLCSRGLNGQGLFGRPAIGLDDIGDVEVFEIRASHAVSAPFVRGVEVSIAPSAVV